MPESNLPPVEQKTGIAPGVRLDSLGANQPAPIENAYAGDPYVKEPLFSKKVIAGWAGATLIVWFMLSFIVPAVKQSVKSAIVSSMEESGSNDRVKVIRTRNGRTITIDENGVTVSRGDRGSIVIPPVKVVIPSEPSAPEAPAATPAPDAKKAAESPAPRR
jgi:hypothetical protein